MAKDYSDLFSRKQLQKFNSIGAYKLIDRHFLYKEKWQSRAKKAQPPLNIWTPQEGAQIEIERSISDPFIKEIAIHGSRGGGKTYGVICSLCAIIAKYGKLFRGIYFKKTAKELEEIKSRFIDLLGSKIGCSGGRGTSNVIRFKNGATLTFSYFDKSGVGGLKGSNLSHIIIEESDDIPNLKEHLPISIASLRGEGGIPTKVIILYNYTGVSYPFLKDKYNSIGHFKVKTGSHGRGVISIKSLTQENAIMLQHNTDYLASLEDLPPQYR